LKSLALYSTEAPPLLMPLFPITIENIEENQAFAGYEQMLPLLKSASVEKSTI